MSLKDSGTKSKLTLRVLAVSLLVVLLAAMLCPTMIVSAAEDAEVTDATQAETSGFKSGYPGLDENATMSDRLMYGLKVAGIGMSVVFLVLIIIMAILYVFKAVAVSGAKKPVTAKAVPVAPAASASNADDEETVVAVATAAIAASRGASACAFKVISITKIQ